MRELGKEDLIGNKQLRHKVIALLKGITCGTPYPASIISGIQEGRIFIDDIYEPQAIIIWHYCGLSYVSGETNDQEFIESLKQMVRGVFEKNQRNIRMIVSNKESHWIEKLDLLCVEYPQITKQIRCSFRFNLERYKEFAHELPEGFSYFVIQKEHLSDIKGRIIPSFSWRNMDDFLTYGRGYGIYDNNHHCIVSTAFSSGIGDGKIDIGIETQPEYRNMGMASLVAHKMAEYVLEQGLLPDWGCDSTNLGSAATARCIGFDRSTDYPFYQIRID